MLSTLPRFRRLPAIRPKSDARGDPEPRGTHSRNAMTAMFDLAPGDVLSYSAGSTQTGPEGYRKLRARPGLLQAALKRWPDLAAPLGERTTR